jgi:hypothetical protein
MTPIAKRISAYSVATVAAAFAPLAVGADAQQPNRSSAAPISRHVVQNTSIAARQISVNEAAHLHLVSHKEAVLYEQGLGSGTFNCPLAIRFTISSTKVGISFLCSPHGGSISGTGSASFYVDGAVGRIAGVLSITHGTGTYMHASGPSLKLTGSISRETYATVVRVSGKLDI